MTEQAAGVPACEGPGCDRDHTWHRHRRSTFGFAHADEIVPPIPRLPNGPVPQQVVDELAAMDWPGLVAYCDMVREGVVDAMIDRLRAA